ncbi:MAG: type II toxin-antitoxin system HicB family antitoxin [Acidobacteriota bacterium]|nr:type II toxin-antitoxin system HicB family antitoxin [Acidobacteriota bacterium]
MQYPVRLVRQRGANNYAVYFPDIPEALTCGDDLADALRQAVDALETALDFYFEDKRPIPLPSAPKRGQKLVELPPTVAATVLLHNEMLRQKVRPIDLAKRMGIPRQELTRMLNLRHSTKIDTTAQALAALGKRLELKVA